eukprot:SAG31_NODE_5089_length_2749_cov_1.514717_1_plen_174_part_10
MNDDPLDLQRFQLVSLFDLLIDADHTLSIRGETVKDDSRWRVVGAYIEACCSLAPLLHADDSARIKRLCCQLYTEVALFLQETDTTKKHDAGKMVHRRDFAASKVFAQNALALCVERSGTLIGNALLALAGAQKGLSEFEQARCSLLKLQVANPSKKNRATAEIKKLKAEEKKA